MMTQSSQWECVGQTIVLRNALDRSSAPKLWPALSVAVRSSVQSIDLSAVTVIDSVGLALLVALCAVSRSDTSSRLHIDGAPAGYADLLAAYRMPEQLTFSE